jgi:transposase
LPAPEAAARDSDLRLLHQVEQEIAQMEEGLTREAWQDDKVRLLMSIPGIDYTVAQTCLATIGDVIRFKNVKKLVQFRRMAQQFSILSSTMLEEPIGGFRINRES